jgi:hypothetical protein
MGVTLRSNIVEIWFLRKIHIEKQGARYYRAQIMQEVKNRYGIGWDQTFVFVANNVLRPHLHRGCGLIKGKDSGGIWYEWISTDDHLCTGNLNVSLLEMYGSMSGDQDIYTPEFCAGLTRLYDDGVEVYPIVVGRDYEIDREAYSKAEREAIQHTASGALCEGYDEIPW